MRLDTLPLNRKAQIRGIDAQALDARAAKRLAELGFDEGVEIEALHCGPFRDPIACRVGRMTIALRRAQAQAVLVEPA